MLPSYKYNIQGCRRIIKLPHDKTLSCFWWSTNKCCLTGSTRVYCVCSSHLGPVCKFCLVLHSRKRQSAECVCVLQSNRYTHREITAGMHTSFSISALRFADTFFVFSVFPFLCLFFLFSPFFFLVLECDWQLRAPVPLMTHDHWQLCEALNTSLASQLAYKHTQTHTRIYPVLTEVCRQTHQIGPCRCDTYTRCFSLYPISQCSKQHAHTLFCIALVYVSYQGLVFPVLQSPPRPPRKRLPLADSGTAWFLAPTLSKWGFNSEVYIHVFYVSAWIFQVSFNNFQTLKGLYVVLSRCGFSLLINLIFNPQSRSGAVKTKSKHVKLCFDNTFEGKRCQFLCTQHIVLNDNSAMIKFKIWPKKMIHNLTPWWEKSSSSF